MIRALFLLLTVFPLLASCKKDDPVSGEFRVTVYDPLPVEKSNNMQLFAHYMPWFEDRTTSDNGQWGWHWTMNTQNPDMVDVNGKRQIASHYYPVIGPYASSDAALIEYHLLLMKYSGIDGVLIDWYGSSDVIDYGTNRRNTEALVDMLDKVGLKFAIVYEDATIPKVMQETGSTDAISLAREDMYYIRQNYFGLNSYIKIDGKPLLLVFGPNYFSDPSDWESIMNVFGTKPCFMPLWGHSGSTGPTSSGEYIWVDLVNIDNKYSTRDDFPDFMGGAWPGFQDFYKEGGAGNTLFTIDYKDGVTWADLLNKASVNAMDYLQLITWNDFGEGTMIEPTEEYGYLFLRELQEFTGISYQIDDLEDITKQYSLRKSIGTDDRAEKTLDQAFYYWVSLQNEKARHLIDSLENSN